MPAPPSRLKLYLNLIRWDRPAGWLLLLWPGLSALWIAASGFPGWHLVWVFVAGTFMMRSAGCCINDVADRDFDRHVKRTAQEDFDPHAFVVRRSMPWADEAEQGLVFVAFGHSLDAYAALLQRMVGADDGIPDALFSFTRPISGAYFWCPPLRDGRLYLKALKH